MTEFEQVVHFYYQLIDEMEDAQFTPRWKKDVYPNRGLLENAIFQGELYFCEVESQIIAAMILNQQANEGYQTVSWPHMVKQQEMYVIHALGVQPKRARQGVGTFMVREAALRAKSGGGKVLRIDVLQENLPAKYLYEKEGFLFVETCSLYYEDTGWMAFDLYEMLL